MCGGAGGLGGRASWAWAQTVWGGSLLLGVGWGGACPLWAGGQGLAEDIAKSCSSFYWRLPGSCHRRDFGPKQFCCCHFVKSGGQTHELGRAQLKQVSSLLQRSCCHVLTPAFLSERPDVPHCPRLLHAAQELLAAVPKLAGLLGSGAEDAHRAAVAITTTDLVSKSAALEVCFVGCGMGAVAAGGLLRRGAARWIVLLESAQ